MIVLDNGDALRGVASTAAKIDYTVHGFIGTTATQLADGQLGDAEADMFLSGANADVVTCVTLSNTNGAAYTVNMYVKPNGGTSRRILPKDLSIGEGVSLSTDGVNTVLTNATGGLITAYANHDTSHQNGGDDEISVAGLSGLLANDQHVLDTEVKLIKLDDFATPDDNTDLDSSTSEHGLLKKLDNVATNFLNGQGAWSEPVGGLNGFIWTPITYGYAGAINVSGAGHYMPGSFQNGTDYGYCSFYVPSEFASLVSAKMVVQCMDTEATNNNWDVWSQYCKPADGEAFDTHAESDLALAWNGTAVTDNNMYEADISGVFSALAAGDVVAVRFGPSSSSDDVLGIGVAIEYSA